MLILENRNYVATYKTIKKIGIRCLTHQGYDTNNVLHAVHFRIQKNKKIKRNARMEDIGHNVMADGSEPEEETLTSQSQKHRQPPQHDAHAG